MFLQRRAAVYTQPAVRSHFKVQKWVHLPTQSTGAPLSSSSWHSPGAAAWKVTRAWWGHGSQKNSPTPTWSQRFFFYCIVIFFSHQDSPTTINNIDWFLSLAHECDLWKRKESCWDSSAKMLKFCLGSDLCAFLMFHPCLTLVLLSWKTSERLHSFPDFDRHRR